MQEILKKHADKLRFLIVGGTNTVLDFGILFSLTIFLNVPKEFANFISTFVAFLFSFFANKKYTFKSTSQNLKKQFLLFAAVTLFGLWVIQTIIIAILRTLLTNNQTSFATFTFRMRINIAIFTSQVMHCPAISSIQIHHL